MDKFEIVIRDIYDSIESLEENKQEKN